MYIPVFVLVNPGLSILSEAHSAYHLYYLAMENNVMDGQRILSRLLACLPCAAIEVGVLKLRLVLPLRTNAAAD